MIGIRTTVKNAALAALAVKPGRPAKERDWELESARAEIGQLTQAIKAQAIELAIVRGKSAGASRPAPARAPAEVKEQALMTIDEAVAAGFAHGWAAALWGVSDDRVHRWRARRREVGTLVDRAPGGNPVHGILAWEVEAVLATAEEWGEVDRSHRKLAHRASYIERVWVSPSTFRRVLAAHGLVLPDPPERAPAGRRPWPEWLAWVPNRIWIWDVTHSGRRSGPCSPSSTW